MRRDDASPSTAPSSSSSSSERRATRESRSRADERDSVRQPSRRRCSEHRADDRDPMPLGDEDDSTRSRPPAGGSSPSAPRRCTSSPTSSSAQRALERGVAVPRREPDDAGLGRRGRERDVAAQALLVVVPRSASSTRSTRPARQVAGSSRGSGEADEQRSVRDLPLPGDRSRRMAAAYGLSSEKTTRSACSIASSCGGGSRISSPIASTLGHRSSHAAARPLPRRRTACGEARRPGRAAPSRRPGSSLVRQADAARAQQPDSADGPVVLHVRRAP